MGRISGYAKRVYNLSMTKPGELDVVPSIIVSFVRVRNVVVVTQRASPFVLMLVTVYNGNNH